MYKKVCCTCRVTFLLIRPIVVFSPSSLPSPLKGDVTRHDLQRRFSAQHSVTTLLSHRFERLQHCSTFPALCCAKNRFYILFKPNYIYYRELRFSPWLNIFSIYLNSGQCFSRALIGYSVSEYPALFTDSPPVLLSERRQTRVSCDQNAFPVCRRNKQRNFTTNQASCSRNTRRR